MHQVRLAEADAAVEQQRVVGLTGFDSHLPRRPFGVVVGFAFDEGLEQKSRVDPLRRLVARVAARRPAGPVVGIKPTAQPCATIHTVGVAVVPVEVSAGVLCAPRCRQRHARPAITRPDHQVHAIELPVRVDVGNQLRNAQEVHILHAITHIAIRCQQFEPTFAIVRLQRLDPSVEFFRWQFVVQPPCASPPNGIHAWLLSPPPFVRHVQTFPRTHVRGPDAP